MKPFCDAAAVVQMVQLCVSCLCKCTGRTLQSTGPVAARDRDNITVQLNFDVQHGECAHTAPGDTANYMTAQSVQTSKAVYQDQD